MNENDIEQIRPLPPSVVGADRLFPGRGGGGGEQDLPNSLCKMAELAPPLKEVVEDKEPPSESGGITKEEADE